MDDHRPSPHLWLLSDGKAGHRSQLQGLSDALWRQTGCTSTWVDTTSDVYDWKHWLLRKQPPQPDAPLPQLLVAAGRRTHPWLLGLKRALKVPAAVIMRPSFPLNWVDAALIGEHDQPPSRAHVFPVAGALNPVQASGDPVFERSALILLGGPSPHYEWDNARVQLALETLTHRYPDWDWHVATSRRTPTDLCDVLRHDERLTLHSHQQLPPDWLRQALPRHRVLWVTPDSVSMVSEALSSGRPAGLLPLSPRRHTRVVQCVHTLRNDHGLYPWAQREWLMTAPECTPLQESDRAAAWLAERFFSSTHRGTAV